MLGESPEEVAVVGVQPLELNDYGGSLSEKLKALLPQAVQLARGVLADWGWTLEPRPEGEAAEPLGDAVLEMAVYEAERPSEAAACRDSAISLSTACRRYATSP